MADFNKPVKTQEYEALLADIRELQAVVATLLDSRGAGASNLPTYAKRWNAANALFQSWESSAWVNMTLSIAGGGTGATDAAAARTALGTNDANNITAGTLASARLPTVPVTKGGTGLTSLTSGSFLTGNDTGNVTLRTAAQVITDLGLGDAAFVGTSYFTLASHGAATSGVHGVTGSVVGTDDAQTLTNKTFGAGTILSQPVVTSYESAQHDHSSASTGGKLGASAASGVLGAWESKNFNTIYGPVSTDGFAVVQGSTGVSSDTDISGYTDANASPVSVKTRCGGLTNEVYGLCMPVRKGDYWKVTRTVNAGSSTDVLTWMPIFS